MYKSFLKGLACVVLRNFHEKGLDIIYVESRIRIQRKKAFIDIRMRYVCQFVSSVNEIFVICSLKVVLI